MIKFQRLVEEEEDRLESDELRAQKEEADLQQVRIDETRIFVSVSFFLVETQN